MIHEFEIGGNEVPIEGSEAIANLPDNRTMIVEHLTAEEPINPEAARNLTSIEAVFAHYQPSVDVVFDNEDGQAVKETLRFANVGDFNVKKMTEQSKFLRTLNQEKNFYSGVEKQIRTNKILQRVLGNNESKAAFVEALNAALKELEAVPQDGSNNEAN
jgi:predicted component of type VI protein secretion system